MSRRRSSCEWLDVPFPPHTQPLRSCGIGSLILASQVLCSCYRAIFSSQQPATHSPSEAARSVFVVHLWGPVLLRNGRKHCSFGFELEGTFAVAVYSPKADA